jgi:P27 family predicted phage terminase small subunit
MSAPGRKPKPTGLKKLAGNPGKRPLNQAEPDFAGSKPRKPYGLPYYASRLWDRLSDVLYHNGLLTEADMPVFEGFCYSFHFMMKAAKILKREGVLVEGRNGDLVRNPADLVYRQNYSQVMKAATEFGLTPSSRSRITAEPQGHEMSLAEQLFKLVNE